MFFRPFFSISQKRLGYSSLAFDIRGKRIELYIQSIV